MRHYLFIAAITLLSSSSLASNLDATLSVGMGKSVLKQKAFERVGSIGVRYGWNTWKLQANGGYWLALAENEKASLFTSLQGGVEVVGKDGVFASVMFGPALIQTPDNKLSGHFQFHPTFGIGIKNTDNYALSFMWQHFSNAGIILPNAGRDLLTLQAIFSLYRGDK